MTNSPRKIVQKCDNRGLSSDRFRTNETCQEIKKTLPYIPVCIIYTFMHVRACTYGSGKIIIMRICLLLYFNIIRCVYQPTYTYRYSNNNNNNKIIYIKICTAVHGVYTYYHDCTCTALDRPTGHQHRLPVRCRWPITKLYCDGYTRRESMG